MNFSEFKALLGADPWNREPETLRARHSGPEFEQAAEEAQAFERKLQAALQVPVEQGWVDNLVAIGNRHGSHRPQRWLAVAASVIIVAGISATIWLQTRPPRDMQQYVQQHLAHDGAALVARATGRADGAEVAQILAGFGVVAESSLAEHIRFIKHCPTPDGRGAHMIVDAGSGPVHVIFLPATPVQDGREFRFGGHHTRLVALTQGAAALVAGEDQPLGDVDQLLRGGIRPLQAKT